MLNNGGACILNGLCLPKKKDTTQASITTYEIVNLNVSMSVNKFNTNYVSLHKTFI